MQVEVPPNGGKEVGYIRVSTVGQNTERQLDGVYLDKIFEEKASAASRTRPELERCLDYVREGDCLHVHSIDRLARNLADLQFLVSNLTDQGVTVCFRKEGLTFSGKDGPMARLMLQMMGAFAEFERALIRERQAEGIVRAKAKGKYRGRKPALTSAQVADAQARVKAGETKAGLARELGVSRQTLHATLKRAS